MGKAGYAGEDGKERVADWKCGPSCPVTLLDQQSGISTSVDAVRRNNISLGSSAGGIYSEGTSYFEGGGYSDKGGASRFFKQVETLPDLIWYLSALVGSEANVMWVRV